MKTRLPRLTIACFGEALWDILPGGLFLGGAPLNVAYHLSRHGVRARPITAVGRDFLGGEIRQRIAGWGLETRFVARPPGRSTGIVRATLDAKGVATYRIARHVAWDAIAAPALLLRSPAPAAVVFGTLALREKPNRRTLARLFAAWPDALRVLDINLRGPFDRPAVIEEALRHTQFLKLNDAELARLNGRPLRSLAALERAARQLAGRRNLSRLCVTAGAAGAGLLWKGRWHWENARSAPVCDTVGAGDAFLGAFLAAILARQATPDAALATACRMGEFVAAHEGATPPYRIDDRGNPRDIA